MKLPIDWLKDYLDTDKSVDVIASNLTALGLEVDGIEDSPLAPFIIARIESAQKHPNADRLQLLVVDTGSQKIQVVCGAPNAKAGLIGVLACPGMRIPATGDILKVGKVRGETSYGMMCSAKELDIGQGHEGILELPQTAPIGQSFALYRKEYPIIDIDVTPNRSDCFGIYGVARDLGAKGVGIFKPLNTAPIQGDFQSPITWHIDDTVKTDIPYVAGRYFRNVKNGQSPLWLQKRLKAIGINPISTLVDITNYITHDLCRPLHVFDTKKLKGDQLNWRWGHEEETLIALNDETYDVHSSLIVTDKAGPQGLGGIMGGAQSGCDFQTTDVFLEVALFNPITVARTGRRLGIHSDARHRFERGVDPQSVDYGMTMATKLILELCGGQASTLTTAGSLPLPSPAIVFKQENVQKRGGIDVPVATMMDILKRLGFKEEVSKIKGSTYHLIPPTWRPDIDGEHTIIGEVMRLYGYDNIPTRPLPQKSTLPTAILTAKQRKDSSIRKYIAQQGMLEAVTYSFMESDKAKLFAPLKADLFLANPISSELNYMRPTPLAPLLGAIKTNVDHGQQDIALFEVGPGFYGSTPQEQQQIIAIARFGKNAPRHWSYKSRPLNLFDIKADALHTLEVLGVPVSNLETQPEAPNYYHPGRSGTLKLGKNVLANFGEIHPSVAKKFGIKGRVQGCEIFLDKLPQPKKASKNKAKKSLATISLLPVYRDLAFIVDKKVAAHDLIQAAFGANKSLITDINIFDIYEGKELGDKKSIALGLTLQPQEKTLIDAEINQVLENIIQKVCQKTGATLR